MAINEVEHSCLEQARAGDFRPLSNLLEQRGYLRLHEARVMLAKKASGQKLPRATSTINSDTWQEVFTLWIDLNLTNWANARDAWLNENPSVSSDTLKSRLRLAEDQNQDLKLLRQRFGEYRKSIKLVK